LSPSPAIHPDFAAPAALPPANQDRAPSAVEIALPKVERFTDPEASAPQQHDHGAKPLSVGAIADSVHHGDDLLDGRRVRRVMLALLCPPCGHADLG
jgi:hypothetical protein